jgi:hypothetical protein
MQVLTATQGQFCHCLVAVLVQAGVLGPQVLTLTSESPKHWFFSAADTT